MNNRKYILSAALVLALVSMACGFNINLPVTNFKTGPTQTFDIQIPMPGGSSTGAELNLEFIAGDLKLAPGASGDLASGTATFNVEEFKPKIQTNGSSNSIIVGDLNIKGIPKFSGDLKNELDLKLSNTPMSLNIKAGAYNGNFELGGLSLENLSISDGGSNFTGAFSEPNHVEMSTFTYSTGASTVNLKGLANANFTQMNFSSGAGDYTLSFDGDLKRDASVMIDSGLGTVNIFVPQGVNARVNYEGGLSSVNKDSSWEQNNTLYSLPGSGPTLTITVKMGAGTLNLKTQ